MSEIVEAKQGVGLCSMFFIVALALFAGIGFRALMLEIGWLTPANVECKMEVK